MAKLLAVFGATGQQGSSVINSVLQDSELSQQYKLRAITRDTKSTKAQELEAKNVEITYGDANEPSSLAAALKGVHTVYAMTNPVFAPNGLEAEVTAGKTIVDTAVEQGVKYIIFSTLPYVSKLSGGKYTKSVHFDAKAHIEEYIRSLHPKVQSAFVSPGSFMENFHKLPWLFVPKRDPEQPDTWTIDRLGGPQSATPYINASEDTGKWVGAILADPDKYEGKTFSASTKFYTNEEIAAIIAKATGKKVVPRTITLQQFKDSLPFAKDAMAETFSFVEEYDYWGPESKQAVQWAVENARGKLTTFEEYLAEHPLELA